MAGFRLVKNLNEMVIEDLRVDSQAYTKGDAVMRDTSTDAIDVIPATSSTTTDRIYGIAHEAVDSNATSLQVAVIEKTQVWECEVANTVNANHGFQKMVLIDKDTVSNTGSDSVTDEAILMQVGIRGAKGIFKFRGDST